jgi:hypothetical protein
MAETCRNIKTKFDFNDIFLNLNVIEIIFKMKIYVALEMETNGRVLQFEFLYLQ